MNQEKISYTLQPMTAELIPAIAEIERECFSHPWSENALQEELFNDTACFIAAVTENGEVAGYAGLHCVLDEGYMNNIAVKREYRNKGLATRLLKVLERECRALGLAFITLEVRESNTTARKL